MFKEQLEITPKGEAGESKAAEAQKLIILYLAYSTSPIPIDDILSLAKLPPVQALNIMEGLKKCRLVLEEKKQEEVSITRATWISRNTSWKIFPNVK